MSKINAIRLVNVNYNHNAYHISDETLRLNGQSTLIFLDNGGGKSVIVQLLTALFVHKGHRNFNKRTFASYFKTVKPTFIMVEWVLDNGAGYCLTGMMVRKSQNVDNNEGLEIINFISEYRNACEQDINHLPVVERDAKELRLKSFAACRDIFEGYKKEKLNSFFYYDMNNYAQSKQYFSKLAEYGIDYREWESILKKINSDESGLSKLFSDCKDEKGLIEKWFLEAVENKKNRDKNSMEGFREIMGKYVAVYSDNFTKIQQQQQLSLFQQKAAPIIEIAGDYEKISLEVKASLAKIVAYYLELERLTAASEAAKESCRLQLQEVESQLVQLHYEEYSADYYNKEAEWESLVLAQKQVVAELSRIEAQIEKLKRDEHILDCACLQERLKKDEQDLKTAEQQLEASRQKNKELVPKREYIGFLLKQHIEQNIYDKQANLQECQDNQEQYAAVLKQYRNDFEQLLPKLNDLHSRQGCLEGQIRAYFNLEEAYNKKWQTPVNALQRNMYQEYETGALQGLSNDLTMELEESLKQQQRLQRKLAAFKNEAGKLDIDMRSLAKTQNEQEVALNAKMQDKASIDEQIGKRRGLLQYLQLTDDVIWDKQRIQNELKKKLTELEDIKAGLNNKLAEYQKQYKCLQTGKTLELSEELLKMLKDLGINVVYGMEWLQKNKNSEERNRELVRQHPFLPYALIMTSKDIEELQNAEKNIYTSFPVPIILRESLTDANTHIAADGLLRCGDVDFYMLFNENLLNVAKFESMLAKLQTQKQDIRNSLELRQQEYASYCSKQGELDKQDFSQESYKSLADDLAAIREKLQELEQEYASIKNAREELVLEQEQTINELDEMRETISKKQQQQEDLQQLIVKYNQYLQDKNERETCLRSISEGEKRQKMLQGECNSLQDEIQFEKQHVYEIELDIKALKKKLARYEAYRKAPKLQSFADVNELDTLALEAQFDAITQKLSGELRYYENNRESVAERVERTRNELQGKAERFGLEDGAWLNVQYSEAKAREVSAQQEEVEREHKEIAKRRSEVAINIGVIREKLNQIKKQMEKDCSQQEPLPKGELILKDFAAVRVDIIQKQQRLQAQEKTLDKRLKSLNENLVSLDEYAKLKEQAVCDGEEKLENLSNEELRTYTANLKAKYGDAKVLQANTKDKLQQVLFALSNEKDFQNDFFRKRIEVLIRHTENAHVFLQQITTVLHAFSTLLEKHEADLSIIKQNKEQIIGQLEEYVQGVHDELGQIDRNSKIRIRDHDVKMLRLILPVWDDNANTYHTRVCDFVESITQKCMERLRKNENISELLGTSLTVKQLYNAVIGVNNVHVQLFKVEAQREWQVTWSEVEVNSGGEGFLSAFVILSCLLYYMRRDKTDIFADRNEGKVLLMDNPFAKTYSGHLLMPMKEIAKKNNTQLISLTGIKTEAIYNSYDNIYALSLIPAGLSNSSYLKSKRLDKKDGNYGEFLSLARVEVTDEGQMDSLF